MSWRVACCTRKTIGMCSTAPCCYSRSRRHCVPRCWRGSTAWRQCGMWRRSARQLGASFPMRYCKPPSRLPEDERQAALARLVASELIFQRGTPPEAFYTFKHALVQDAAHDRVLRNARRQVHAQIAEALESHFPEIIESQPELLARHYAEAGLIEKSIAYWGKAGRRSVARSAMKEAAAQFQKALDQLALLPENSERQRQELEFRTA